MDLPEPEAGVPAAGAAAKRGYLVPGVIALAFLAGAAAIFNFTALTNHGPASTLAGANVERLVALGLQAQRGDKTPPDLRCPATEPIRAGFRFVCTLHDQGTALPVAVTETDGRGTLTWKVGG